MPEACAVAWRRPSGDLEEQRPTVPYSWHGWLTVHAHRWQYTPPWGCTYWALPRVKCYRGGDEYCNDTLLVQLPLLGHVVFWKPWGRLRTTPCDECLVEADAGAAVYGVDKARGADA